MFPWHVLIFLKRSLVFPTLLFSSISLHWSLRKAFLSLLAILWNSAFKWVYLSFSPLLLASLLFTAICKDSSDSHFASFHFFSLGMILFPWTWLSDWTELNWTGGSDGKESACDEGDPSLIPGLGRSPGEEKGYPLQYSSCTCAKNFFCTSSMSTFFLTAIYHLFFLHHRHIRRRMFFHLTE